MNRFCIRLILFACLAVPSIDGPVAHAQFFNQRDDQYRVLGLKRAKESYETSRKEYERQRSLFEKGLISQSELDRYHNAYADAEVNYQQSLLAVLFEQQYVTIDKAIKYQAADGSKHVRLRVDNASGGSAELQKLLNIDDRLFRSLQPEVINNVYVSLLNDQGAVISQPYESKIDELKHGEPQQIDFLLLQDLDVLTVNMIYGKGTQRSLKIYLQKDASENRVILQSQQFSQEVDLGQPASFDLTLELFSGLQNTFQLEVVNLPREIERYFKDPGSQARLSQFKFTENTNARKAALQITLPDRPTESVLIDKPIQFFVLVIPRDRAQEIRNLSGRHWTENELSKLKIGFTKLEVLPRGKGKMLVRAPQLYHSIKPDGSVEMYLDVVNEGSRPLDNVVIETDMPLNWTRQIDPAVVSTLAIGEERRITFHFSPPPDVSVGRYEIRVRTSSVSDSQPVQGEDKTVTVEVVAPTNIIGTALIVIIIVGLIAGIVIFGIKLSRR
jgi:hypothetical protein